MIKQVKEMRLDELIKYVWDNGIEDEDVVFKSKVDNKWVCFDSTGVYLAAGITKEDVFEIIDVEHITEGTKFDQLIEVDKSGAVYSYTDISINEIKDENSITFCIPIDGELVKIWQRGEENV